MSALAVMTTCFRKPTRPQPYSQRQVQVRSTKVFPLEKSLARVAVEYKLTALQGQQQTLKSFQEASL